MPVGAALAADGIFLKFMNEEKEKITVIVRTSNSQNHLCKTLESIKDLGEIIAIDENSTDDTLEIIKSYRAKVIYTEKNNLSCAYNQALSESKGDWILLLENNEAINQNLKDEINKAINRKRAGAFYIKQKKYFYNKELKAAQTKVLRLFRKDFISFEGNYFIEPIFIKEKKLKIYSIKNNYCAIFNYNNCEVEKDFKDALEKIRFNLKTFKDNKKPSLFLKPLFCFLNWYIFKKAVFEGKIGFLFSFNEMIKKYFYELMIFEKEMKKEDYDF